MPTVCLAHRQKGVCVVLSDFYVKEGFEPGLKYLAGGKYDLFCVQVLSPQEIEPDLQGDLKLKDIEDDDMAEVSITQPLIEQYKANLNAYCLALKDYITRRGGTYLFTSTAVPFDTLVLNYLREAGCSDRMNDDEHKETEITRRHREIISGFLSCLRVAASYVLSSVTQKRQ